MEAFASTAQVTAPPPAPPIPSAAPPPYTMKESVAEMDARLVICDPDAPPVSGAGVTGIFAPESPPSRQIRDLSYLVFGICIVIFVVVQGFLVVAIFRGIRARRVASRPDSEASAEPVQIYGSIPIEIAWTVIPSIIVFVLTMVTIRTLRDIDITTPPENSMEVVAIGHQWWWEFRYPGA